MEARRLIASLFVFGLCDAPLTERFSHEVPAAILVSQNNETVAMLMYQTNPVGVEIFSYVNFSFFSNKYAWVLVTWVKRLYSSNTRFGRPRITAFDHTIIMKPTFVGGITYRNLSLLEKEKFFQDFYLLNVRCLSQVFIFKCYYISSWGFVC